MDEGHHVGHGDVVASECAFGLALWPDIDLSASCCGGGGVADLDDDLGVEGDGSHVAVHAVFHISMLATALCLVKCH